MPYVDNEGVSIYYEVEGEGPPLVLLHGLTTSLEPWRQIGYVEALRDDYRLILVDARGHGASDKPHDPEAYRFELMAADVVAVLEDLKISKAHFLGYSMGGWIGLGIAKCAPERFHSLIIGGYGPPDPEEPNSFLDLFKKGMDTLLETFGEMFGQRWTPEVQTIVQSNDLDALIALVSVEDFCGLPGFEDVLPTVTLPCLFFVGEDAREFSHAQECVARIPNATFVSLPGLDHIEACYRIDLVLPHITKFLAEVSQV